MRHYTRTKEHTMTDPVSLLIEAIDRKDAGGIRAAYAPEARLVAMTPNSFQVAVGADDVAATLSEWFTTWEQEPSYAFLGTIRDGDRALVEFERVSTFEGTPWVVRQAHVIQVGPEGITEHRMYCVGPRAGEPELAATYAEGA
jgi:ketosteroid isomerase-like protein